jgi:uncharacterized protein YhjY with autotransporter beta-barrel domain
MTFSSGQLPQPVSAVVELSQALTEERSCFLKALGNPRGSFFWRLFSLIQRSILPDTFGHVAVARNAPTGFARSAPTQRRQDGGRDRCGKLLLWRSVATLLLALALQLDVAYGGIEAGGKEPGIAPAVRLPNIGSAGQTAVARVFTNAGSTDCRSSGTSDTPIRILPSICSFINALRISQNPDTFLGVPLQQLSPQSDIQVETVAISSPQVYIKQITQQLATARQRTLQTSASRMPSNARGGAAGADGYGFISPWGISLTGSGSFGDRDTNQGETGFSLNTQDVIAIVDYAISQRVIGGLSVGYDRAQREFDLDSGNLDTEAFRVAPFMRFIPMANSYVDVLLGYSHLDLDSRRRFSPVVSAAGLVTKDDATANFGGDQFFFNVGAGYTHNWEALALRGYVQGDFFRLHVDGYTEKGGQARVGGQPAGLPSLHVNSQMIYSFTSTLGAEVTYAISTHTYAKFIIPRVSVEWVHEFTNDQRTMNAQFQDPALTDPRISFRTVGPIRDWGNVGAGIQLMFSYGIVGFIDYKALLQERTSNHTVAGGVRVSF